MPVYYFISDHVRKVLLFVAFASFVLFIAILIAVETGLTSGLDHLSANFFPAFWGGPLDLLMLSSTFVGNYIPLSLVILVVAYLLSLRHKTVLAAGLLLVLVEAGALVIIFKDIVSRLRPVDSFYMSAGFSFPSGHTALATAAVLSLVLIIFNLSLSVRSRVLLSTGALFLAFMIIFSRLYLNMHWFSDVAGGMCLGIFASALIWAILGKTFTS